MEPLLLTIGQAAARLGISYSTCSRLIRSGELPALRRPGVVRVADVAVTAMIIRWLEEDGLSDLAVTLREQALGSAERGA